MYLRLLNRLSRPFTTFPLILCRPSFRCEIWMRGEGSIRSKVAEFRIRSVSGHVKIGSCFKDSGFCSYKTELLEVRADDPALHVVFIPGNPGMVMYYKDFVDSLYEQMDGRVSITAVGHLSHSKEDWENGRLFSLQERIVHEIDFIREEMQNIKVPMLLVGPSIGSHISLEIFQRSPAELLYQSISISNFESGVIEAVSDQEYHTYHMMRYVFFMVMTEFQKLKDEPNWAFMRAHRQELAFLFGIYDRWGPLQMHGEISKQVPEIALPLYRQGDLRYLLRYGWLIESQA